MSGDKVPTCPPEDTSSAGSSNNGDGSDGGTSEYKMETAPFDPRFPNQNQAKHCAISWVDYQRCIKLRGEDYAPCQYFQKVYKSICPNVWIQKFDEQLAEGKSPFRI